MRPSTSVGDSGVFSKQGSGNIGTNSQHMMLQAGSPGGPGTAQQMQPFSSQVVSSPQVMSLQSGTRTPPERFGYAPQQIQAARSPTAAGSRSQMVSGTSTPISRSARPSGGLSGVISGSVPTYGGLQSSTPGGGRTPPLYEQQQNLTAPAGVANEVNSKLTNYLQQNVSPGGRASLASGGGAANLARGDSESLQQGLGQNNAVAPIPSGSEVLMGSSLEQLMGKLGNSLARREQALREQELEKRQMEELLHKSKAEFSRLATMANQLQQLQQNGLPKSADAAAALAGGPERPRLRQIAPFYWVPSPDYIQEFEVSGEYGEVVTKVRDFEDQGWVIPVGGTLRLIRGGIYRWSLRIERKCPYRPQLQFGIHGLNHNQPWRLITTSRCSRSRDDDPWQDRPGGDRLIDEGDFIHIEADLRGLNSAYGTLAMAINNEAYEVVFEDIPLNTGVAMMPVVSMGGDQSRVRLCPFY